MADIGEGLRETLGAAYTIERELGGGGMSRVFVALDNTLHRQVVIKLLPPELAATVSVERFNREIMLSAALQHPHIVPVLSAGVSNGLPYFIMPFIDGESLRMRLARGPCSVREAVNIMKDVARALSYAHGRGVIHRDIKPDNILFSAGTATVTDFGVAKAITASRAGSSLRTPHVPGGTITGIGTSLGTPAYMAPEQVAADPNTDHRADLYSLGIVAYEMLVGAPPFQGRTPQALLAAQLTEPPPPIASRRYDVPNALAKLITQCLEKDAAQRPKSAAEVIRALEDPAVIAGEVGTGPVQTAARRVKRTRTIVQLAILATLLAAIVYAARSCSLRPAAQETLAPPSSGAASAPLDRA
ncbi:MAG: serine/threonine-protein kinase [Gemmatimonadaceae bacterium]